MSDGTIFPLTKVDRWIIIFLFSRKRRLWGASCSQVKIEKQPHHIVGKEVVNRQVNRRPAFLSIYGRLGRGCA